MSSFPPSSFFTVPFYTTGFIACLLAGDWWSRIGLAELGPGVDDDCLLLGSSDAWALLCKKNTYYTRLG